MSKFTINPTQQELIEKIDVIFGKMEKEILAADVYGECYTNDIYIAIGKYKNEIKAWVNNIFDQNWVSPKKDDGDKPKNG